MFVLISSSLFCVITVKDTVVTVEMYSKFNDGTTYYFAYGDGDPISFKTASNKASEVASIEIDKTQTYPVDATTAVKYYLKNADGVILQIDEKPVFTVVSGTAGWFTTDNNIFFFEAGKVNIKASFVTGEFDEATSQYVEVTDTATLEGTVASTTKTGTKYSLGAIADEIHQIRMNAGATALTVKYTYSDGADLDITSGVTAGYSIKSVDETIAAIQGDEVVPVNVGSTTIVLYKGTEVLDAFPIQVLEANRPATASVKLSKNTLNMNGTLKKADGTTPYVDQIEIEYTVKDLDGTDLTVGTGFTAEFTQVSGNATATTIDFAPGNNATTIMGNDPAFAGIAAGAAGYKTFRIQVEIKYGTSGTSLYKTVLTFTVGNEATADSYKLKASKTALDTSIKNWGDNDPKQESKLTVVNTKTSSYGDFACGESEFDIINSMSSIVATMGGAAKKNYVIFNAPSSNGQVSAANGLQEQVIKAFKDAVAPIDPNDLGSLKAKAGTYTFTGYHVEYTDPDGDRVFEQANKSSLGTVSVVVSGTDAKAKATVINGKASEIAKLGIAGDDTEELIAGLSDLIQVSWEGLTSLKTTDANFGALGKDRVQIVGVTAVLDDSTSDIKYYVRSVKVQLFVSTKDNTTKYYYGEQTVDVKELFKDK